MKCLAVGVVMMASACGWNSTPPQQPAPPENHPAVVELHCKTVVEHAGDVASLRPKDITMAIGECEQQEWSQPTRQCLANVKTAADVHACRPPNDTDKRDMFAEHMDMNKAMKVMAEFKDKMCACKDTACAQQVSDEMAKWSQDQAKDYEEPPVMTDDDTKRLTQLGEAMGKCMQSAMTTP
jgi:hypothetical protein